MLASPRISTLIAVIDRAIATKGMQMGKILENLYVTLAIGVILAVLVMLEPSYGLAPGAGDRAIGIFQWLHVFFGITWIGLLYYFNFVQIPTMPTIPGRAEAGRVQIYRAERIILFPLGRGVHRTDRPDPGVVSTTNWSRRSPCRTAPTDRHRHVAGADHGGQRVGDHLAQSAARIGAGRRPTTPRRRSRRALRCLRRGPTSCCRSRCCSR